MRVAELMTKHVWTCSPYETLERVARIMWDHDLGAVPVVDDQGRTAGVITDRDVAMAAYTQGKALGEIPVWIAASSHVVTVREDDTVEALFALMRENRVRRVPVVGDRGQPIGIVTLGDVARRAAIAEDGARELVRTIAAIVEPRKGFAGPAYRVRSEDGRWVVRDRDDQRLSADLRTQGDAVVHAKELARRDGAAQIIVYDEGGRVISEFFYQADERSALASDDMTPTLAASRPAHAHH